VRLGNCLPMFRRNVPLLFSELWVRELTHNLLDEGETFVRNWRKKLFYLKSQGNENIVQYYVGTLNSKNLAVFTVGSLSFCSFTARPGRQNVIYCDCTVVRSFYFYYLFIFLQKPSSSYQVGDLRKDFVTNVVYDLIVLTSYCRNMK
jgi:hypothetical protein